MSGWDGYVNDMMKDTGSFDNAIILGLDDRSIWAATSDFKVRLVYAYLSFNAVHQAY